ncbi:PTS sugar transporter subunit IIBC [Campylobacter concisus]|uniref:PTS sugar transporter subunit IIBC n=1 Tax=Campylobacter concisus TaxID=199 RepID=UPI000B3D7886|nr:PTS sugar transporter subunit IIBC [Campylobacter concisus]OUT08239.1 PTS sugar transporter subunit IIBC [Campylobacter concisus]
MELILQRIIDEVSKNFGKEFLEHYLSGSFGSMSKSETEILIFHLLSKHFEISSNYEISNLLKISETKVKNLTLNAHLRYPRQSGDEIVRETLVDIAKKFSAIYDEQNGEVKIHIQSSVQKREMINAINKLGSFADYGLNNEILKIRINTLFSLFEKFLDKEKFKDTVQTYLKDKKLNEKQFFDALNNSQRFIGMIKRSNIKISYVINTILNFI